LTSLISASGSSDLQVHSTTESTFPKQQTISKAHKLGCHHVCTARGGPGNVFASVGFSGEIKIWALKEQQWELEWEIAPTKSNGGDVWAVALSADEGFLACTTSDGRIHVWDIAARQKIQTYETGAGNAGGSFAMAVDLSSDGKLTASGHQNGAVYVFNNDAGRMVYSLSGKFIFKFNQVIFPLTLISVTGLVKPVRTVAFSPGCQRLAAAGDAGVIALYDMKHGEHVSNLVPSSNKPAWITSVDWNSTGEYLVSGSLDGKARVWDVARSACAATHSETESALWSVRWLPRSEKALAPGMGKAEMFCATGANRSLTFYREATGS